MEYTSRVQEYPIQCARIFVESKAQKRRHSGATSSFCNAAIGEKMRALNRVFLIARSINEIGKIRLGDPMRLKDKHDALAIMPDQREEFQVEGLYC